MSAAPPFSSRWQEARFQTLVRLLPSTQLFTIVDVALLLLYFWPEVPPMFLLGWAAVTAVHAGFWGWFALWARLSSSRRRLGLERLMGFHAAGEALLFSAFLIVVFPLISPSKAIVLGAFAMGLLAAGGFSKFAMPAVSVIFVVLLGVGAELALARSGIPSVWIPEALVLTFGTAVCFLVFRIAKIFDAWVGAQEDLDRQNTLVTHLLDDFEESASEGLWETDEGGHLTFVSPRLVQLVEIPAEDLVGRLLAPGGEWKPTLEKGVAFRNLVVPVEFGKPRWWSLSAKPLKDATGRITGWRGVGSDITGVRLQELEMVRLSRYDRLTGLLNRQSFLTLLTELLPAPSTSNPWCLAVINLVDFKDVNESQGHLFGDALLFAVAERMRESVAESLNTAIQLARLDGDEFALWGPVTRSIKETKKTLKTFLDQLAEPFLVDGIRHRNWFRMGVSFLPSDAETPDQWLRCADLALRTAKDQGKSQLVLFSPSMMESYRSRKTLREDLAEALGRGELSLVFQPLIDLKTGSVTGFEALTRWNHPVRGAVPPSVFIPLAEETELILSLGLWVLEQACLEARNWPVHLSVSVNLSGVQLRLVSLAADVEAILDQIQFDPHRLILEVTESALIKDDITLDHTFAELKKKGIRLALDDFGTGFSSLSYLQSFPFDKLKIDQAFVRPVSSSPSAPSLLASIVSLARSLGLSTTAEGIEDETHLTVLQSLGCDEGQGYYFSRPIRAMEIPHLLAGFPVKSR